MSRTYVRTPSGGIRYVPSGPRGTDRVPGILRTLTPTVLPVDIEPCRSAPVGRVIVHPTIGATDVDRPRWRLAARMAERNAEYARAARRAVGEPKELTDAELAKRAAKAEADQIRREDLNYRRSVARTHGFKSIGRAVRAGVLPR